MAHNLSWIDRDALRTLVAETAYRRVQVKEDAESPSSTFVAPPVETSSSVEAPAVATAPLGESKARKTASVRRASRPSLPDPVAVDAPATGVPSAPPVRASMVEPFMPSGDGSLEARLELLMGWACKVTGLARAFVADAEGLLVASLDTGANAVDEAAAIVELCAHRIPRDVGGADAGTVTMVAGERTHVVAWDLTRHGKTYIALSGTVAPTPEVLSTLSRALRDALR